MYKDTIAAISTAIGDAGIGIVRLSGADALPILLRVFRRKRQGATAGLAELALESHRLYYGFVVDPETQAAIDEVLVTYMAQPATYTREPVVEIDCHGGPVPLREVLALVLRSGARLAEPGEFTLRAFLNGRLDLAQAEAVLDVIRARTRGGLQAGLAQLGGSLSSRVGEVRYSLLKAAAHLEATIDFPEEEVPQAELVDTLQAALTQLEEILSTANAGIVYRQGVRTAIVGRPNVGKSSLLNALLRFERAIVTDIPGTTRDTLEETLNLGGVPFVLVDTAGISAGEDLVEQLGVERSRLAVASADMVVVVLDGSMPLTAQDRHVAALVQGLRPLDADKRGVRHDSLIVVVNKADLPQRIGLRDVGMLFPGAECLQTSVPTGEGLQNLEQAMLESAFSGRVAAAGDVLVTSARHEQSLHSALDCLVSAESAVRTNLTPDVIAIDLRGAIDSLGQITGETVGESILEEIFSNFCIGK